VYVPKGSVTVRTRTGRNVTAVVPELHGLTGALAGHAVVLDGELVAGAGLAAALLRARLAHGHAPGRRPAAESRSWRSTCCTSTAGTCARRLTWSAAPPSTTSTCAPPADMTYLLDADLVDALAACAKLGLEGFVAKGADGKYRPRAAVPGLAEGEDADMAGGAPQAAGGAIVQEAEWRTW
jgi:hypothetical protein